MALNTFGFIFTGRGLDPSVDRFVIERGDYRAVIVGMDSPVHADQVARDMVADGIQLIELCGGFGPVGATRVLNAIDHAIPVGAVGYGPESISGLARLFPDTEAADDTAGQSNSA